MKSWSGVVLLFLMGLGVAAVAQIPNPPMIRGLQMGRGPLFLWGAVAHDDQASQGAGYVYNKITLPQQMALLNQAGLNAVRAGCSATSCAALIAATRAQGIALLGGITLKPSTTLTEAQNYAAGYVAAKAVAAQFPALKYYEVGNELDNWVGMTGDGSTRSQYSASKLAQARGLINGEIAGFHSGNPQSKALVDDAGWCHYGFLQALWADGVRWDITAVHWYSNMGNIEAAGCNKANVAQIHAAFGLPVWITEYNSSAAATTADATAEALWISNFVQQIAGVAWKYNIQAAFAYELLDETNISGAEGHYGIADGTGTLKVPIAAALRARRVIQSP
jgi:hypothetical protein